MSPVYTLYEGGDSLGNHPCPSKHLHDFRKSHQKKAPHEVRPTCKAFRPSGKGAIGYLPEQFFKVARNLIGRFARCQALYGLRQDSRLRTTSEAIMPLHALGPLVIDLPTKWQWRVEEAIEKVGVQLKEGTSGTCDYCGDGMSIGRLRAVLFAIRCTTCQEEWEAYAAPSRNGACQPLIRASLDRRR